MTGYDLARAFLIFFIGSICVLHSDQIQGATVRVYWTDWTNDCVWRASTDGTARQNIFSAQINSLDGLAIDPVDKMLYVGTSYDLQRSKLDGSGSTTIVHGNGILFYVYGVRVDSEHRKVYWSTWEEPRGIRRANLDGSSVETVFTGATTYHMDIDPIDHKLYFAASAAIYRANLDGSSPEILVNYLGTGHFGGLALDVAANKMYFSTWENGGIYRANIDGSGVQKISDDKTSALALDIADGKIYWTSWALGLMDIQRANLDGSGCESLFLTNIGGNAIALEIVEPAMRRFNSTCYSPQQAVEATIEVNPTANVLYWALEDQPPAGWVVDPLSIQPANGHYDSSKNKVKWIFEGNSTQTLSYRVSPPANTTADNVFRGTVSFNGVSSSVKGTSVLYANPTAPISITVDRDNFCADDSGNICLSAIGGSGTVLSWYAGNCGEPASSVGTGSPLCIPSPETSTVYHARWENSCGNSACAQLTVTVVPRPPAPSLVPEPATTPGLSNTVSWNATGEGGTYYIECSDNPGFNPVRSNSGWITATRYEFSELSPAQTYWYRVKYRNAGLVTLWSQTTQTDYDADLKTNVSTSATSGDVILQSLFRSWMETFDEPGTSWSSTIFPNVIASGDGTFVRETLESGLGAPNTSPVLPINQNGDLEGRYHEITMAGTDSWALMADMHVNLLHNATIDGYVGIGYPVVWGGPTVGLLLRASSDRNAYVASMGTGSVTTLRICRVRNGCTGCVQGDTLASSQSFAINLGAENYHLRFSAFENTLTAQMWRVNVVGGAVTESEIDLSSEPGIQNSIAASDSELSIGRAGLKAFARGQSSVFFDDIVVEARDTPLGFVAAGNIVSTAISLPAGGNWGEVAFSADTPTGTSLSVDVLDGNDAVLLTNVLSGTSLAGLDFDVIKLRANLSTNDASVSPVLHDWSVTYADTLDSCPSEWSSLEYSYQCPEFTVVITSNPGESVCEGGEITLDAGSGYASYLWSPGGQTTQMITVTAGGTYSVSVIDSNGCQGTDDITLTVQPMHPAEVSRDWQVVIDEVTAYGSAWKTPGANWPVPPSPIPAGYVSKCGQLWMYGEKYHCVLGGICPTGCWEPDNPGMLPQSTGAFTIAKKQPMDSVVRSLSANTYLPNQSMLVSIAVTPNAETQAYVVEETPPAGWTVSAISHEGVWDSINGKVKWGLFFGTTARTLTYEITPPAGETGSKTLEGIGSFDGMDVTTIGITELALDSGSGGGGGGGSPPPTMFTLTVNVIAGLGTVVPPGGSFAANTIVSLTAVPANGYRVKAWTGTLDDSSTSPGNQVVITADQTVTMEFEPIPLVVSAGASAASITAGEVTTLTATASGGLPPYLYQWTPAASVSSTDAVETAANPTTTTTYEVLVTDALGQTGQASVTITVAPASSSEQPLPTTEDSITSGPQDNDQTPPGITGLCGAGILEMGMFSMAVLTMIQFRRRQW